jgi:uncharacterized protein YecE (DUF72 family)
MATKRSPAPQTRIGISGWRYGPWRGTFYPDGLAQRRELEFASRRLNSIEINGSFYSLQRPKNYQQWYAETPDDFVFSVKGGRYITHMRKLKDVEQPLANFLASGILCLKEKLGPFLWQFPPQMQYSREKFESFFKLLPRTTTAAAELASRHDDWMKGRAFAKADADRPLRHAVEIRHHSFQTSEFVDLLREHDVALVFADTAGKWPYFEDVTSDFVYARLHGEKELYVSGYDAAALDWWAARLSAWRGGSQPPDAKHLGTKPSKKATSRDVFVYFDNDVKVRAPFDAMALGQRLGVTDRPLPIEGFTPPESAPQDHAEQPRTQWPPVGRAKPKSKAKTKTKTKPASPPRPPPSRWPRRPAGAPAARRRKAG